MSRWLRSGTRQAFERRGLTRPGGSSPWSSAIWEANSAAVRLKRHPDARSQGSRRGALRSAAHRQALGGQGARGGGADGCELRRRASAGQQAAGRCVQGHGASACWATQHVAAYMAQCFLPGTQPERVLPCLQLSSGGRKVPESGPTPWLHLWKPQLRTALSCVSGPWVGSGDAQKAMWQG